jgi:23S rRNA (uracil1939-C5)-methyltransferase
MDVSYAHQLILKMEKIHECTKRFLPHAFDLIRPIMGCDDIEFYRNKMDYSFGLECDGVNPDRVILGLKRQGKFDEVVPLSSCLLMSPLVGKFFEVIEDYFSDKDVSTWNYHTHTGLLRHLVIRHSKFQDAYVLNFIVSARCEEVLMPLATLLTHTFPVITSVLMSVNDSVGDHTYYTFSECLFGTGELEEKLEETRYVISPLSFFQSHSRQAEVLYRVIRDLAELSPDSRVLDLYSGLGSIGLFLSHSARYVIGIEENEHAVEDAKKNALLNGVSSIEFRTGRVKNILKFEKFEADCIVTDPPRSGMAIKALTRMAAVGAPRIIYVSCNPVSLFEELAALETLGYVVDVIQPVDMFPHTVHVETVVRLIRN